MTILLLFDRCYKLRDIQVVSMMRVFSLNKEFILASQNHTQRTFLGDFIKSSYYFRPRCRLYYLHHCYRHHHHYQLHRHHHHCSNCYYYYYILYYYYHYY